MVCRQVYRLFSVSVLILVGVWAFFAHAFAVTTVPEEYYPNYKIQGKREKMIDILENIEATVKVGGSVTASTFAELNQLFATIFPYFPKNPSNNVIYKQCDLTTKELASGVTTYKHQLFKERCFSPIGWILKQIAWSYTVKANATAKPTAWPAPLNVTFDARASLDPSIDTIPSDNFFWWYKDVKGTDRAIGRWPVVNYTFPDPGNHIVHLTVRSANRQTEGVFDGEKSLAINVAPPAAQLIVFINGKRATPESMIKVWLQDGVAGVLIDASATRPMGARTIVSHQRQIVGTQTQKYSFKQTNEWVPGELYHQFPGQGIYQIILEVTDNENNKIRETYLVSISDPVAIIRAKPEEWTTSTEFLFDGSASYSVSSKIRKYQRQIINPQWNQTELVDAKQLTQRFLQPGLYTVKLVVTDIGGAISTDTYELNIGSTPPVPSFVITPTTELKFPSRFVLDASATFDADVVNGSDSLTYRWSFSSPDQVTIDFREDGDKRLIVSFNTPWTYRIQLTVTDRFWQSRDIEKMLVVESTLRPEIVIAPLVSPRGSIVSFFAKSNKPVVFYERIFGDGKQQQTDEPKITHTYTKAGIYEVSLRAVTSDQEENVIKRMVFAGQNDQPLAARVVRSSVGNVELTPTVQCETASGAVPAYRVDRYEPLLIDATASRNLQGQTTDLRISFRPQNDEIHNKSVLNYKFLELWCQWMDVFVEDINAGKIAQERVWFEVNNALPIMQNLVLEFPQAKNQQQQIGVGFGPTSIADEWLTMDTSLWSIIVKASVQWPRDPDGSISYYRRRYYPNNDDSRKEGFKITPAWITTVTFVIPKPWSPTEYSFVVEVVDNDGGRMSSERLLWKWPVLFFPPGEIQLDQPIVALKTEVVNARVGEEVRFRVVTSIPSERPDFEATRVIKFDFDGDGIYDLTTKKTDLTYVYSKPWTYTPKVAVFYRDRAWVWYAESLNIVKAVTPRLLYATKDRTVLVRDVTLGDYEEKTICMDMDRCLQDDDDSLFTGDIFIYTFPDYGQYTARLSVIDAYANELEKKDILTIRPETWFALLSIPSAVAVSSGAYEIALGSSINNTVSLYLYDEANCYLDLDITADSDGDGDPVTDEDVRCKSLFVETFIPTRPQQEGRIYRVEDGKVKEETVLFRFLDIEEEFVPAWYEHIAKEIDALLNSLPLHPEDTYQGYYRESLVNLKKSLADETERASLVIQIRDLVWTYPSIVPTGDKEKLAMVLTSLTDPLIQSAYGGTVYETAKTNILAWFQEPALTEIKALFASFERAEWNQSEMKASLDAMINRAADERKAWRIDEVDFNYIRNNLCDIILYFDLPSKTCGSDATTPPTSPDLEEEKPNTQKSWSTLSKVLRIMLIIVVVLGVIFGLLVVLFAIKAKKQQEQLGGPDTTSSW